MTMISELVTVLEKGNELANAETWKNRQMAVGALAALLGAVLAILHALGFGPVVDADTTAAIAGGIVALYGLLNAWLTAATSARVGLPPKRDTAAAAGQEHADSGPD